MKVIWEDENFAVKEERGFHSLITKKTFQSGEEVCRVEGEEIQKPNRYSVQVTQNLHINVQEPVMYINHDCNGNIELIGRRFVAKKDISVGEEIAFDYNSTEDELAEPFTCLKTGKVIKGRKYVEEKSVS